MAPDPEGFLKELTPTKDDWRLLVGGVGALNTGWLNGMVGKYLPEDMKSKEGAVETAGALASWVGYKLSPRLKGSIGEAVKSFCLGSLFVNIGLVGRKYVPQLEFQVTPPAGGMPYGYGMPAEAAPPAAPPAPQTVEELAALEAQTSTAKYFGKCSS